MERHVVTGPGLPRQIGPYSHAVRAGGLVYVAGQPGVDLETGEKVSDVFEEQARQAFVNLEAVLRASDSRLDLVVSTTVLVTELANFPAMNALFGEFFPVEPPTRMTMQVPLPLGLLFSIGVVAVEAPTA
jgi:2-iminobutanoate/2-iminopropanoate deaminase